MENVDPMGIHTGDSIVVAPSQTLSDKEHQLLRTAAIKIIRALGIEGGCNVQFAYDPACTPEAATTRRSPYYVIEVNPRVSRSSALASKATGYPIARVAAKIAVGRRLDEITNAVTRKTTAAFEPALDYVVVKIPRWPFDKFPSADRSLGTQMKATGEVMAIERSFEAALQKAVRSLELKGPGFYSAPSRRVDELIGALTPASDERLGAIFAAFGGGATVDQVRRATGIDPWFLRRIEGLVRFADADLRGATPNRALLWRAKRLGFSDADLGALLGRTSDEVRTLRRSFGIRPVYKMVDTCAAEFEAATPYFYSTYEDENEAEPLAGPKCVVLGAGPIRIGQGIEFDCCAVQAAQALQDAGVKSIMINSNPETVSTDFDASARLYFEPLDEESVAAVLQNEGVAESALVGSAGLPVLAQFGGQTALDLSDRVAEYGGLLAGTSAAAIAVAEDRRLFHEMCERLGIAQPQGGLARDLVGAYETARSLGYPVLVRPSYVLGGRAMDIARDERGLERIFSLASQAGRGEVLIDKYIEGLEVEVDAVSDGVDTLVAGIMEHVERAGIHSGDSFAVYPPRNLLPADVRTILAYTSSIATALPVRGLLNIQFIVRGETVYVLEANTRASRTVPFLTKVTGVPLVRLAVEVALGASLRELGYEGGLWPSDDLVAVKAPVFSTGKLAAVDARLGPEMRSTGEVIGAGRSFASALWKALLAAGVAPAPEGAVLVAIGDSDREQAATVIDGFYWLGYELIAAPATAEYVRSLGLPVREVTEPVNASSGGWTFGRPEADAGLSLVGLVQAGRCALVINTAHGEGARDEDFAIRRAAVERGVPCFSSLDTAAAVLAALRGSALDSAMRRFSDYRRSPPAHRAVA
jgi:carbamoyl-phosphate synthase large subunit